MRRVVSAFFVLSALALATPAAAQEIGWFGSVGIGGGWGDLGSWNGKLENLTAGARGGYQLTKLIGIQGEMTSILHAEGCSTAAPVAPATGVTCTSEHSLGLVSTDFSEVAAAAKNRPADIHINGTHIDGNAVFTPTMNSKWFRAYVTGGFTYWVANAVRETDTGLVHNHIEKNPGFNVGGGVYIPIYKYMNINLDYRHFSISADETQQLDQVGVMFGLLGHVAK
jgi:opacity protein-like surface antigen